MLRQGDTDVDSALLFKNPHSVLLQQTCPSLPLLSLWKLHGHEYKTLFCSFSSSALLFSFLCLLSPQSICLLSVWSSYIWSTILLSSTGFIHQMSICQHPSHLGLFPFKESSIWIVVSLEHFLLSYWSLIVICGTGGPILWPRCTSCQDWSRVSPSSSFSFWVLVVVSLWTVLLSRHGLAQFQQLLLAAWIWQCAHWLSCLSSFWEPAIHLTHHPQNQTLRRLWLAPSWSLHTAQVYCLDWQALVIMQTVS